MRKEGFSRLVLRAESIGLLLLAACSQRVLPPPKVTLSSAPSVASNFLDKKYFADGDRMWFCSQNQPGRNAMAVWVRNNGQLILEFPVWKGGEAGFVLNFSMFEGSTYRLENQLWVHDGSGSDATDSYEDYIIFDERLWGKGAECFQVRA